jgi:hypothetical protein
MAETVHLRGEGGGVFAFDLPLSEDIGKRFEAGALVRVNEDGSAWSETEAVVKPLTPKEALQEQATLLGLDTAGTIAELTDRIDAKVVELREQAAELEIDDDTLSAVDLAAAIEAKLAE